MNNFEQYLRQAEEYMRLMETAVTDKEACQKLADAWLDIAESMGTLGEPLTVAESSVVKPKEPPCVPDVPSSHYVVKTIESLAMVLAGFPSELLIKSGGDLDGFTIAQLRELKKLPAILSIDVPYRLRDDSVLIVNLLGPEWDVSER